MKRVKKSLKRLAPKVLNFFIILLMLFQPVGTPGMLVAIAEDAAPAVVESAPEPTPKVEPEVAPVAQEPASVVKTIVEEPPVVVPPVTPLPTPDLTPVADDAAVQGGTQTGENQGSTTGTSGTIDPAAAATEKSTPTPEAPVVEPPKEARECLSSGAEIKTSQDSDWEVTGDMAKTKDNVKLGVKYEFPGNQEVSVTFTCLPTDSAKLAPLKIEQIRASEITLPDGVVSVNEYAYDITTDGMDNGDFKYDLSLPKADIAGAEVKYIEQSADEVVTSVVTESELKKVDEKKVKEETASLTVTELDHFTVFVVTANATVANNSVGTPDNGWISDNAYATFNNGSDWAEYGFPDITVPAGSVIDGIEVLIEGKTTGRDLDVSLWNTSAGADAYTSAKTANLSGSDTTQTVGGPNDKWGKTWASTDFTDATFKVKIDAAGSGATTANLDQVQVKVYYNAPISWPTSWTTPNSCVTDPSDESPSEVDLLGTIGTPAVGFASDSNYQYFRERIEGNPGTVSDLNEYSWVVLFQTSAPQYQYLGTISGKSNNKVLLYDNTTHSPDSGGVDFSPLFNDPADNVIWEGSSSDYGRVTSSGGQYYIDWAIPLAVLTPLGIDSSTTKFFATSTNANNYNKDHLQCYEAFADLSVVKSDNPDPVVNGGTLTYTLAIHNAGPDTASGVVVTDTLPTGYAVTSVTPSQGSCSDTTVPSIQCELGSLANGANATVTIVGTITTAQSSVTNDTAVTLDTTVSIDIDLSNNTDSEDTAINPATGTVIVHKDVQGPNGEALTDTSQNFTVQLDGSNSQSITDNGTVTYSNVLAGAHTITESAIPAGYSLFSINPDSDGGTSGGQITVTAGQTTDVYIINRQPQTTLTVNKIVIIDNGGTAVVSSFPLFIDGNSVTSGVTNNVASGAHTVSETNQSGYSATIGGDCAANGTITLALGDDKTCTITNDDQPVTLIVKKIVTNNDGGTLDPENFSFQVNGGSSTSFETDGQNDLTVDAGTYSVTEPAVTGYTTTYDNCTSVVISNGGTATCTITNDDIAPTLTLVKTVINLDGGDEEVSDFILKIDGVTVTSGVQNTLEAGFYTASEITLPGYEAYDWAGDCAADGSITLLPGDNKTCTITNDDIAPRLTLVKSVTNDDNGNAGVNDFGLTIGGVSVNSGEIKTLSANTPYAIDETGLTGYAFVSITGNLKCPAFLGGLVTLDEGDDITCTITNDDTAPKLTLVKDPTNDDNGNAAPDDFALTIGGNPATSGTAYELDANTPYAINETLVTGYTFTSITGDPKCPAALGGTVTLDEGDDITCTITNDDTAPTIKLIKNVVGGSAGVDDFGLTIGGSTVNSNVATDVDANTPIALNEAGKDGYTFTEITGDEDCPDVLGGEVTLDEGDNLTCTITNTRNTGSITVNKVIDADGDLGTPGDQTPGAGWEFDVNGTSTDTSDPLPGSTDGTGTGSILFDPLKTGEYNVTETLQDGYDLIGADCGEENGSLDGNTVYSVDVSKDTNTVCTFYNTPNGTIHGYKWNDLDGSRSPNGDETKLSGWTINLYRSNGDDGYETDPFKTMDTDDGSEHFGWYWFEHLLPGEYKVCEVLKDGWNQTYPNNEGEDCHFMSLPDGNSNGFFESQNATYGPEYNFGNQFVPPVLTIEKFNDQWPVTQVQGAIIDYTITVRAEDNNVNEVIIKDLLPEGFSFQSITSVEKNGNPLVVDNPAYASPGTWNLGDMIDGDEVVIKFKASIGGSQDPGTYKDLAWAEGTDDNQGEVLATSVAAPTPDNGTLGTPGGTFVGTQIALAIPTSVAVELNEDRKTDTDTKTKRVLGAALPATGASNIWISLVAILATIGGGLMLFGRRKKILANSRVKSIMKVFILSLLGLVFIGLSGKAQAITPLSVRIEDPKPAVNDPNFKIGFVVLDINNDTPSVVCEVDDGGGFVDFPAANVDYTPLAGGNSGDCLVDAGIMPADGSYSFRVTATSSVEVSAGPVSVDLETGTPGTPLNYDRDDDSCTATFTTANDGLTAKVELYRSTELDFTADASTFAKEVAVGPNVSSSITDPGPNCDDYYYAIRAVSAAGAGSGFAGDEKVTVRHRTRTRTITIRPEAAGGAIPVSGGAAGGAGAVTPGTEGTVGGAETEGGFQPGQGEEGKVLGEEGLKNLATPEGFWEFVKNNRWYFLGALALLAFIYYGYRRNKKTIGSEG